MGWTIKIQCQECDYDKLFWLGVGFNYIPEYIFYGDKHKLSDFIKDKEEQKYITELMEKPEVQVEGSESRLYRCLKCNQLYDKYYYCIRFRHGEHRPKYTCSNCGGYPMEMLDVIEEKEKIVVKASGNNAEINCPRCGSLKILFIDGGIDWD